MTKIQLYIKHQVHSRCLLKRPSSNSSKFFCCFFYCLFSVRLLSVLRGHSFFHPLRMTSDFVGFLYQILSITLFSYLISWERAIIFPFQYWVPNKGTTGTICITYLVWRGPWQGIEPGTSRTRSQHSSTRLSRSLKLKHN